MSLYPVIERELRVEARQAGTQWLRPLSAGVAVAVAAFVILGGAPALRPGPELFGQLHHALFIMVWVLVPIMTADCISRERREQTLGLLFLTPLRAGEVVLAKVLAQGLRAATVCIAVFPVLLLPVLMGGVNASTIWAALLAQVGAFFWALAAGILASVLSRTVLGGLGWSVLLTLLFLVAHASFNGLAVQFALSGLGRSAPSAEWLVGIGLLALWNPENVLDGFVRLVPPPARGTWLVASSLVPIASVFGLAFIWSVGAWRLRRAWQELPPSPRREQVSREMIRLRFAPGWLKARLRRGLERNPVGWLEQRRWNSRAAVWGWVGVLALAQASILGGTSRIEEIQEMNILLAVGLTGVMVLVSAASLRRERETGVLELLLTTPLAPRQIVAGRLHGIWRQFLPAMILFSAVVAFVESQLSGYWWGRYPWQLMADLSMGAIVFVTAPVGGLWWSLRSRTYAGGVLMTIATLFVLPWMIAWGLGAAFPSDETWWSEGPAQWALLAAPLILGAAGIRGLCRATGVVAIPLGLGLLTVAAMTWPGRWVGWQQLMLASLLLAAGGWAARMLVRDLEARGSSSAAVR